MIRVLDSDVTDPDPSLKKGMRACMPRMLRGEGIAVWTFPVKEGLFLALCLSAVYGLPRKKKKKKRKILSLAQKKRQWKYIT